jgi:signal transduction histidine kinase
MRSNRQSGSAQKDVGLVSHPRRTLENGAGKRPRRIAVAGSAAHTLSLPSRGEGTLAGPTVVVSGENPGALHVVNRDLTIVAFNDTFRQWNRRLGLPTRVIGRRLSEVFSFLAPQVYEEYGRVFDHGQILISEETNTLRDRTIVTETHKIPVFEGKAVHRVVTIIRDITARKSAEKAVALYQAKLKALASELKIAEERERRRLAAELHDRITQHLAMSKLDLQSLLASTEGKKIRQSLTHTIEALTVALEETQALTSELSSPILAVLGLESALSQYLTRVVEKKHRLCTEFHDDGRPKPLSEDVRSILFRDVRELLVNVAKHAKASRVRVSIGRSARQVRVCVQDDGIGFDPDLTNWDLRRGFGLLSIQEGLERLGGRMVIQSDHTHGTVVTLTAPVAPATKDRRRSRSGPAGGLACLTHGTNTHSGQNHGVPGL